MDKYFLVFLEKEIDRMCAYVLRRKCGVLWRELHVPETKYLIGDSRFPLLTHYECEEVCGSAAPREQAEKLIRAIEIRGFSAYTLFITVLKDFKPLLVNELHECKTEWSLFG